MSSMLKSIFKVGPNLVRAYGGAWPARMRTLGAWAVVAFARLKELAPYAMIELVLPGGSMLALTLWLYRRRKKVPSWAASFNALL
jgi:hypothetical protein